MDWMSVAGVIMPGINGSGIKSFTVNFTAFEPQTVYIGSGLLLVYSEGGQSVALYGVDYWTTTIEKIYGTNNSPVYEISKSATSGNVSITTTLKRNLHFLFLGE